MGRMDLGAVMHSWFAELRSSVLVFGVLLTCSCGDGISPPDADATADTQEPPDHSVVSDDSFVCEPGTTIQSVSELADLLNGPWHDWLAFDAPRFVLTDDVDFEQDLIVDSTDIPIPSDCPTDSDGCYVYFWANPLLEGVEVLDQISDVGVLANWTRIRVHAGRYRIILTQMMLNNRKYYCIGLTGECSQECPSPYLACPNRLCLFQNKSDYCLGCLNLSRERCACMDLDENSPCSYTIYEDSQSFNDFVGTCQSGRCI